MYVQIYFLKIFSHFHHKSKLALFVCQSVAIPALIAGYFTHYHTQFVSFSQLTVPVAPVWKVYLIFWPKGGSIVKSVIQTIDCISCFPPPHTHTPVTIFQHHLRFSEHLLSCISK